jgi:hypothetical protein
MGSTEADTMACKKKTVSLKLLITCGIFNTVVSTAIILNQMTLYNMITGGNLEMIERKNKE